MESKLQPDTTLDDLIESQSGGYVVIICGFLLALCFLIAISHVLFNNLRQKYKNKKENERKQTYND